MPSSFRRAAGSNVRRYVTEIMTTSTSLIAERASLQLAIGERLLLRHSFIGRQAQGESKTLEAGQHLGIVACSCTLSMINFQALLFVLSYTVALALTITGARDSVKSTRTGNRAILDAQNSLVAKHRREHTREYGTCHTVGLALGPAVAAISLVQSAEQAENSRNFRLRVCHTDVARARALFHSLSGGKDSCWRCQGISLLLTPSQSLWYCGDPRR